MVTDVDRQDWNTAVQAVESLASMLTPLQLKREQTLVLAREGLAHVSTRREALLILGLFDEEFTEPLIDELLAVALSDRDVVRVRGLLGKLSRAEAQSTVPAAVSRLLTREEDGYAYRRMAEMLDYLGLEPALRELCDRARDSLDEDVREVAEEFGG